MKVDPVEKIMLLRSVELSMQIHRKPLPGAPAVDVSPPIACHEGTRGSLFRLQRMQNSTVNARDSRFILVRALDHDRVIALRPIGVSLCVGLIVSRCLSRFKEPYPLLYSQEARVLVGLQCRVLVGLYGRNPNQTRYHLFLAVYPMGPASTSPRALYG